MPSIPWYSAVGTPSSASGVSTPGGTAGYQASSRPISRAPSPAPEDDALLNDYLAGASRQGSVSRAVPQSVANSPRLSMGSGISASSPANPLEIVLDSDHLVLRGQGGEMNSAYLTGYVSLWLDQPTNIKDITMNLSGKAKVQFSDSSKLVYSGEQALTPATTTRIRFSRTTGHSWLATRSTRIR